MAEDHQLGDAPVQAEYRELMNNIARGLDAAFNGEDHGQDRKTGFVLLVFPFGDQFDGRCNYISNGAARDEIVVLFKEQIKRFEGMAEPPTGHA